MSMIYEDREDHEGYAARRLPDGTLTSTWTRDDRHLRRLRRRLHLRLERVRPPFTHRRGRTAAEDQWEPAHARRLLAAVVPSRITALLDNLREEVAELADGRPVAAHTVARPLTAWADHIKQLTRTAKRQRDLNTVGRHGPERGLSL